jgi:RNA polymerase sigma-70 factor (ECF subfamily)
VAGGFHRAGEIDAGDHREAAHYRRLAGDGEAILVVDAGIVDPDGYIAVHQVGFVEVGQRGLGAAVRLLDYDRLECRHERLTVFAACLGVPGACGQGPCAAMNVQPGGSVARHETYNLYRIFNALKRLLAVVALAQNRAIVSPQPVQGNNWPGLRAIVSRCRRARNNSPLRRNHILVPRKTRATTPWYCLRPSTNATRRIGRTQMQRQYALAQTSKAVAYAALAQDNTGEGLLARIADGDRQAMRTPYGRHSVKLYRFVLRLVGDEAKAEDIVSEVFFDVWRQADRFEGRSQVVTWIFAIARFKALTARRSRRDQALDQTVIETVADTADNPEAALQKKSDAALLRTCIAQLSADHREVIDLVYYHNMSVEQAAAVIGVPQGAVKTRMFYARKQISELYLRAHGRTACHA